MKRLPKVIAASFVVLGAVSISAQIILLRELLSAFYGNELSIGIILACWMFLISAGSIIFGSFADKTEYKTEIFTILLALLALSIPATVFLSRAIKHLMGLMPGEVIGFGPAFYFSLIALSCFCLPYGFLFPLGSKILSQFSSDRAKSATSAYFLEAAGTVIAGSLVSLILIKIFSSFHIAFTLSLLVLIIAVLLSMVAFNGRLKAIKYITLFLLILNLLSWPMGFVGKIEKFSEKLMWRPFNLIKKENSIYGNIAAVSEKDQFSFYSSGGFIFTVPDIRGAEETVHYPLALHPDPRSVLLVGGGLNGSLGELYKYNLTIVEYIELDPTLIKMAEGVVGGEIAEQLKNPVLKIRKGDGRFYIKTASKKYDIIILAIPAPHNVQINRFYTKEFFTEAKKCLGEDGILSLSCEGGENYIGIELAEYLGSIYKTLCAAGFMVKIIPGENINFIAFHNNNADVRIDPKSIQQALDRRRVKTAFIRDYYLRSGLSPERVASIEKAIIDSKKSQINTDFKPVSYYYDMVLWATTFQPFFNSLLRTLNWKILWGFILFISLLILLTGLRNRKATRAYVIIAVGTTGFAQISIEISIMLAFQAIYGYLYYAVGIIITAFMAGLFAGSFLTSKRMHLITDALRSLKINKIALSLFSFCLIPIFKIISTGTPLNVINSLGSAAFPGLVFAVGVMGGMQFALASKVILDKEEGTGTVSGLLYGADLIGGVLGALLLSAIFIPILGIFQCLIAAGIVNLVSAVILKEVNPLRRKKLDNELDGKVAL